MKMIVSLLVDDLRGFEYYKPKSKISYFCESTQPLGPLFLWQCLVFLFFPIDILHLSKELVPLFSFYFSSTRKAPNNGVLLSYPVLSAITSKSTVEPNGSSHSKITERSIERPSLH